ncbi:MAG: NADP-dependent phosphogluconate dehydrogenase, partial [Christensenellales bacterium]
MKMQAGVVGLAVMGKNLALNIESRGYGVAVYNRSRGKIDALMEESRGKNLEACYTLEAFCQALETPRIIILMVQAGEAVDQTLAGLAPYLDRGDIILDGGNSFFMDTIRRSKELAERGLRFIGAGISGGEEGALKGPAIMPGGDREAYEIVAPMLDAIAAKVEGQPCCTYCGTDGAGHYVKMVHNGIEYGDMQLIGEAYWILRNFLGLDERQIQEIFEEWNWGELDSYLIEITANILKQYDEETGKPMVDVILDTAGQKGTGKWTGQSALELGVAAPTIAEAVFARSLSARKEERVVASRLIEEPSPRAFEGDVGEGVESVRRALYCSKICSYAQGFALMVQAAKEYSWDMDYGAISMIFRGGCIIRAQFLHRIKEAFDRDGKLPNLLLDPYFNQKIQEYAPQWRETVSRAMLAALPAPAFASALGYYDGYRSA